MITAGILKSKPDVLPPILIKQEPHGPRMLITFEEATHLAHTLLDIVQDNTNPLPRADVPAASALRGPNNKEGISLPTRSQGDPTNEHGPGVLPLNRPSPLNPSPLTGTPHPPSPPTTRS